MPPVRREKETMLDTRLKGRVALVTGSGRGIGRAIAERLAHAGARVALHDHTENSPARFGEAPSLTHVAAQMEGAGGIVRRYIADIADGGQVHAMAQAIAGEMGPVEILVNCAGGDIGADGNKPVPNDCVAIPEADVRAVLERNLLGTILVCQAFVPQMQAQKRGAVINITSVAGQVAVTDGAIYAVAKAGIAHYTLCLAAQVAGENIRVNAVSPGPTWTARFAATRKTTPEMEREDGLIRYGRPENIADVVVFLASDEARFVSGQQIAVDGGLLTRRKIG